MYRFWLTSRWIVAGVVVLVAVGVMVQLGLWQLRRHDEVRTHNERVRARIAMPADPLDRVIPLGTEAIYRRVEVSGRYDEAAEVALDNRSHEGSPGRHLLTPLVTASGRAIIVDRGWIPLTPTPTKREVARPSSEPVVVVGVLFESERRGRFGAVISPEGRATALPRVDVPRIAKQLPYPTYPLYLRLESQNPSQRGDLPVPPGPPVLDAGPHLSYAVQWFIFATIALGTSLALARREGRKSRIRAPA